MISDAQRTMAARILGAAQGRSLRKGARGVTVRALQLFLRHHGFDIRADGVFGPITKEALQGYQTKAGINPDGVLGSKTFRAVQKHVASDAFKPASISVQEVTAEPLPEAPPPEADIMPPEPQPALPAMPQQAPMPAAQAPAPPMPGLAAALLGQNAPTQPQFNERFNAGAPPDLSQVLQDKAAQERIKQEVLRQLLGVRLPGAAGP